MEKKLIGILPLVDTEKDSYWMLPGYMKGIEAAGGIPVMLPLTEDRETISALARSFDAFLFTGGPDVSPALYGESALASCGPFSEARDAMEPALLREVLALDKPVLGICRGLQLINAALGGTLYQDLPTQHPSEVDHHMTPPYNRAVHRVALAEGTMLRELLGAATLGVNSYHHQAIKTLAAGLTPVAVSEDGLVEGFSMPERRFVLAVQWHPEFCYQSDAPSLEIFRAFVRS